MTVIEKYQKFVGTYGDSFSRYLGRIQVLLMEEMTSKIEAESGISLSHSQIHCLQSLCLKGMKQSELSERLGISKQALSQLISVLEKKKLVKKIVDSEDTRRRILIHTQKGKKLVSILIDSTIDLERRVLDTIGSKSFKNLKKSLNDIENKFRI